MVALSDNTATNVIIEALGGPDAINLRLAAQGLDARLLGWFSGSGIAATGADELVSDEYLPTSAGVSICSVSGYAKLVEQARMTGGRAWELFESVLATQQDRRSLARYIRDDVKFAHKTGTVAGIRHDAGWLTLGAGILSMTVFTDGPDRDEQTDDPACLGMARAAAWSLAAFGGRESLIQPSVAQPRTLLAPLSLMGDTGIRRVLAVPDVLSSLRSLDAEQEFWLTSLTETAPAAWTLVDENRPVGLACLYGTPSEPGVGIYIEEQTNRRSGIGRRAVDLIVQVARARGSRDLHWVAAADNVASAALAESCGFSNRTTNRNHRKRGSLFIDEARWTLDLSGFA